MGSRIGDGYVTQTSVGANYKPQCTFGQTSPRGSLAVTSIVRAWSSQSGYFICDSFSYVYNSKEVVGHVVNFSWDSCGGNKWYSNQGPGFYNFGGTWYGGSIHTNYKYYG